MSAWTTSLSWARCICVKSCDLSLDKDAPVSRTVQPTGVISSRAILGGPHHYYAPRYKLSVQTGIRANTIRDVCGRGLRLAVELHPEAGVARRYYEALQGRGMAYCRGSLFGPYNRGSR